MISSTKMCSPKSLHNLQHDEGGNYNVHGRNRNKQTSENCYLEMWKQNYLGKVSSPGSHNKCGDPVMLNNVIF